MNQTAASASPDTAASPWLRRIVLGALAAYVLLIAAKTMVQADAMQTNFFTSYYAATAHAAGENPYDAAVLQELAGGAYVLPYVYPPATLWLFRPFTWFDYAVAARLYLCVKLAAYALMIGIWYFAFVRGAFGDRRVDVFFLLICLFGFNYAIHWDMVAGNVNAISEAVLWVGLLLLLRGSLGGFAVATAAAAWFKLTPILFLGLLIFERDRRRWGALAAGAALFALLQGASFVAYPELSREWKTNIGEIRGLESGAAESNLDALAGAPSTRLLIDTLIGGFEARSGITLPDATPKALYAIFVLAVGAITFWTLWRDRRLNGADPMLRRIDIVLLATLAYVIALPRVLLYGYVLVLPAAYVIARRMNALPAVAVLFVLMLFSMDTSRPPGFSFLITHLAPFYPLLLVYALWAIGVRQIARGARHAQSPPVVG